MNVSKLFIYLFDGHVLKWPRYFDISEFQQYFLSMLKFISKAHFTLGVRAEKTWGQLWAFLGCKLAPKLLINAKTLMSAY
jgi:hypothetical protein